MVSGEYKLISTEELKAMIDKKEDMLIIDTMPYEDSYKKSHVPGAEAVFISDSGHGKLEHDRDRR